MRQLAGLGRKPRLEMSGEDLLALVDYLDAVGIDVWLDGGWAVDAVLRPDSFA